MTNKKDMLQASIDDAETRELENYPAADYVSQLDVKGKKRGRPLVAERKRGWQVMLKPSLVDDLDLLSAARSLSRSLLIEEICQAYVEQNRGTLEKLKTLREEIGG